MTATLPCTRVINRLVKETGDDGIRRRFGVANGLHQNFYENWGSIPTTWPEGWPTCRSCWTSSNRCWSEIQFSHTYHP